jgi:hypothetical protein
MFSTKFYLVDAGYGYILLKWILVVALLYLWLLFHYELLHLTGTRMQAC